MVISFGNLESCLSVKDQVDMSHVSIWFQREFESSELSSTVKNFSFNAKRKSSRVDTVCICVRGERKGWKGRRVRREEREVVRRKEIEGRKVHKGQIREKEGKNERRLIISWDPYIRMKYY